MTAPPHNIALGASISVTSGSSASWTWIFTTNRPIESLSVYYKPCYFSLSKDPMEFI